MSGHLTVAAVGSASRLAVGAALTFAACQVWAFDMFSVTSPSSFGTPRTLILVDVATATQTPLGGPGAALGVRAMDTHPITGELFGGDIFDSPGVIQRIDPVSGVSSAVAVLDDGGSPLLMGALAFDANGTLYTMVGNNLFIPPVLGVVDLDNATFQPVLTLPEGRAYQSMDFGPDGLLYALYNTFPGQSLERINVAVPAVLGEVVVGSFSVDDMDFAPDANLYHSNFSSSLFRMDPLTGVQTQVGPGITDALGGLASRQSPGAPLSRSASFVGDVVLVDTDTGTGQFAGMDVGSEFAGIFRYGTSAMQSSEVVFEPTERNFKFLGAPFASTLFAGAAEVDSLEVSVNMQDNVALDVESAILLTSLLGEPVLPGTVIDTWTASALSVGAFEQDPNPNDGDDEELLFNGALFDMVFIDLSASIHSYLGFKPAPPAAEDVDLVIFTITEGDAVGNVLYFALGVVHTVGDLDQDSVGDLQDNCLLLANPLQRDSNGDGFGNLCDADLDGNCSVDFADLSAMKSVFFSNDADADLDGNGAVDFSDLSLMKDAFFASPGPSELPNGCFAR